MDQGAGLGVEGGGDIGVRVPKGVGGDAGDEVEIFLAGVVPEAGALAAHEGDRGAAEGGGVVLLFDGRPVGV